MAAGSPRASLLSMTSPKIVARVAGSLYLVASVVFVFAMALRPAADHIRSSPTLFRVSLAADLVATACFLLTGMALYVLLEHVDRLTAAAMVVLVTVETVVAYLADLDLYAALTIVTNADYAHELGADASRALVTLFTELHSGGLVIDELFFGIWLVPLGYLVIRSRQFPRLVGLLLIVAAVSWTGQFLANLLAPDLPYVFVIGQVGGIGEFVFVVWLLVFGIRLPAPDASAATVATSSARR